jgi:hypothetical protein
MAAMLNIAGNLCEMGELDPEHLPQNGCRIERPDGSLITILGLTRDEVRGLSLYVDVTLNVTADAKESA